MYIEIYFFKWKSITKKISMSRLRNITKCYVFSLERHAIIFEQYGYICSANIFLSYLWASILVHSAHINLYQVVFALWIAINSILITHNLYYWILVEIYIFNTHDFQIAQNVKILYIYIYYFCSWYIISRPNVKITLFLGRTLKYGSCGAGMWWTL